MIDENDENRIISKKAKLSRKKPKTFSRYRTRDTGLDFRAQYQLNYEHLTNRQFTMYLN